MGNKYLDTKNNSLESSVLGVWKTAIEEGEAIRDDAQMTKKEDDLDEASVEEIEELYLELSDEEFDAILEEADEEFLDDLEIFFTEDIQGIYEKPGLLGKIAKKVGGAIVKRIPGTSAKRKHVIKKAASREKQRGAQAAKIGAKRKEKQDYKKAKAFLKTKKKASVFGDEKLPNMREALMKVRTEKHDTHVDPEDREELDKKADGEGGVETAKKMKRSKEPAPNQVAETNKNDKSDDGEGLDSVQPKAVKKKFKDRKDKDIDNDGDVDDSDKFLHKRRKAVSKAVAKEEVDLDDNAEEYAQTANFKIQSMKAALAQVWGMEEGKNPFAEHKGTKPHKHPHDEEHDDEENKKRVKTETGKKPAVIDLKPKIEN